MRPESGHLFGRYPYTCVQTPGLGGRVTTCRKPRGLGCRDRRVPRRPRVTVVESLFPKFCKVHLGVPDVLRWDIEGKRREEPFFPAVR